MSFHLTTTELAFAVPAGVIVGAAISLIGQRLTNVSDHKRSLQERLWNRRSESYARVYGIVEIFIVDVKTLALDNPRGADVGNIQRMMDQTLDDIRATFPEFTTIASSEVHDSFNECMENLASIRQRLKDLARETARGPVSWVSLNDYIEAAARASDNFREAVRIDLRTKL